MNIEQVHIEVMHARLTVNTPAEEKDTLLQAVGMLNGKAEAIREGGRVADSEKIVIMAALNVVHDLLKTSLNGGDLAIGDFARKIADMDNACQKALSRLAQEQPLFPCGVREGIYSFEPISSLKVAGSSSGRERPFADAPETTRGSRLVSKVQADSAETALAGIPIQNRIATMRFFTLAAAPPEKAVCSLPKSGKSFRNAVMRLTKSNPVFKIYNFLYLSGFPL